MSDNTNDEESQSRWSDVGHLRRAVLKACVGQAQAEMQLDNARDVLGRVWEFVDANMRGRSDYMTHLPHMEVLHRQVRLALGEEEAQR
jgi:hypothetical protein